MSSEEVFDSTQAESYQFGEKKAPKGFDPDIMGWRDPSVGLHLLRFDDFNVRTSKEFRIKDRATGEYQTIVANQLEPRLVCADGDPDAGASVIDFIPLPGNYDLPVRLANQWGQFLKSFGFDLPDGELVPSADFKLSDMKNRVCVGDIAKQVDADGNIKQKRDGTDRVGVKMFGYSRPDPKKRLPITGEPKPKPAASVAVESEQEPFDL
jgi:hypothetical protein